MKFKDVGEVTDDSWYEAFRKSDILESIEQIKKDALEVFLKKNNDWIIKD